MAEADELFAAQMRAEGRIKLKNVLPESLRSFQRHTDDFGDDWIHEIIVEKRGRPKGGRALSALPWGRACLSARGQRRDLWLYYEKLKIIQDPDHLDHEDIKEWRNSRSRSIDHYSISMPLTDASEGSLRDEQKGL